MSCKKILCERTGLKEWSRVVIMCFRIAEALGGIILDFCIQILDEADTKLAYQTCSIICFYFLTFLV